MKKLWIHPERSRGTHVLLCAALAFSLPAVADDHTNDEATAAVTKLLAAAVKKDGSFRFFDAKAQAQLELVPEDIRVTRRIHGYGYFVDVNLHAKSDPKKPYDIDFWLDEHTLALIDTRIHKGPKREGDEWKLVTRSPLLWWWIPASEHPGEFEEKRGWEVESAVNKYIASKQKGGVVSFKDDKTGQQRSLQFVEIHRPLRKLEGKGYFACTDFREVGKDEKYYDVDIWLVEKDGKLEVTEAKIHKEPKQEDGVWIQVPRYNFDDKPVKDIH